ncbi:hypothetical protein TUSST3_82490 [Streptomyces sp. TUS-ST3]|uniref:hypothetical protein n=1 Tax=Streptomyces sp. TUS-ST3 TaxID=3025591 RepID=UPI00235B469F|nr:hypothetical protein [Streptomyces sp. TUS-ST3]GLP71630.1 hypothetical protein TUSST3_82490 [Streptomyces sp. TUS-ST3]
MSGKDIDDFEYVETNQCISAKHTTPFGLNYDMDQMKDMVRDADPGTVKRVATAWESLSKDLVGPGGIKETLDAAVEHVLAHWEGQSADLFRARAQVIGKKITDSSKYATHTSVALQGAAAVLDDIKPQVMAMEKPGKVSSALDYIGNMGDRDDSGANNALKSGESSQSALDGNAGSLSEGREAQLRMAVKMEALGAAYNSRAAEMGQWKPSRTGTISDGDDWPGDPGGVAPAPVVVPTETTARSPRAVTSNAARSGQVGTISTSKPVAPPSGITGGAHKATPTQPQVNTAIDGVAGGRAGAPSTGSIGTVGGGTAGGGGVGVGGGAGFVGGAVGGAAGSSAARGGMVGRAGAGAGTGGMAGRAGAGGVGGAGAKGAAGRVGGSARGGVVGGTPKSGAGAGRGTAGGSGLHSSRGAAGKGASAVRKGGIAGALGTRTGRRKEDEQHEGERPDYLVEDEETWTPQTNVAPRVIE